MLSGLSVAFPASRVSEVEANARLEMYASELADIPADILRTAMRRSVRECDFFPTVKELRKLAGPEMAMRAWRLMMMKHMAKEYDRQKPEGEPLTDEQRAKLPSLIKSAA